jgi:hypothetical protein
VIAHAIHIDRVQLEEVELRRRILTIEDPWLRNDRNRRGGFLIEILARRV